MKGHGGGTERLCEVLNEVGLLDSRFLKVLE